MDTTETPATAPVKQKTGIGKIIAAVETAVEAPAIFIGKEAGVIAKLFSNTEPAIQSNLKTVSGIIQILKVDIAETPDVLVYAIKKAYPAFDLPTLQGYLSTAAADLGVVMTDVQPTLQGTIAAIQAHATPLSGNAHANFWTGLFNLVGALVSPGTPWGKLVVLGVFIYNNFVKPKP